MVYNCRFGGTVGPSYSVEVDSLDIVFSCSPCFLLTPLILPTFFRFYIGEGGWLFMLRLFKAHVVVCLQLPVWLSEMSGYLWCTFPYTAECIGEWQVARILQIDFSAAFDRVNHRDILYKLCSVGFYRFFCCLHRHSFFQIDHSTLWWEVVGVNWLTLFRECRRVSVLGPLLLLLYTSELFSILENKLIGYVDDSTAFSVMQSPGVKSYSSRVPEPWIRQG